MAEKNGDGLPAGRPQSRRRLRPAQNASLATVPGEILEPFPFFIC